MKPKPIKSPVRIGSDNPIFLVKLAADLLKVHNQLMPAIDAFTQGVSELKTEAERIKNLPKGEKGDKPKLGIDYWTKQDKDEIVREILAKATPKKGIHYNDGESAEMPDITILSDMVSQILSVKEDEKAIKSEQGPTDEAMKIMMVEQLKNLEVKDFPALERALASYRSQLARPFEGGKQAGKIYGKDTWARGGGSGSTSSGKTVTTQYLLTAVQAGDDVTIDLTQLTNWATFDQLITVTRNNIPQTQTLNFTLSGSTLTILNAVADDVFNATYSYS